MNKNRQSVINDDSQKFNFKVKSRKSGIVDNDYNDSKKDDFLTISKKSLKKSQVFPNDLSSQRTDKNLLLKQNINSKLSGKIGDNILEDNKMYKKSSKNNVNFSVMETMGNKIEEDGEKEKKIEKKPTISSWDDDLEDDLPQEDVKKEINKKWYKAYYLTNLAMKLNHGPNAVKYCDEMITLCDESLNIDQIKIILAANSLYINELRKSQRGLVKLLMEEKEAKNLIYEIKSNKEKAIIERCQKFIKLINDYILTKNNLLKEHQALKQTIIDT